MKPLDLDETTRVLGRGAPQTAASIAELASTV